MFYFILSLSVRLEVLFTLLFMLFLYILLNMASFMPIDISEKDVMKINVILFKMLRHT